MERIPPLWIKINAELLQMMGNNSFFPSLNDENALAEDKFVFLSVRFTWELMQHQACWANGWRWVLQWENEEKINSTY